MKINVNIELEIKDDKYYYNILAPNELTLKEIRSIIAGALSLSIRGEKTPQGQGKALKDIVDYLENDLVSLDSFADTEFLSPNENDSND